MSFTAIILAAGKGTRMKSEIPKPLHHVAGKPMLSWVINAAKAAGASQILPVIGHESAQLEDWLGDIKPAYQTAQLGTGHAVLAAEHMLEKPDVPVIILFGDTPLITADTIKRTVTHIKNGADICALGFEASNPAGYGRFILDDSGRLVQIIEDSECSEAERQITFVNGGILAARAPALFSLLRSVKPANSKGEIFLTDVITEGHAAGLNITSDKAPQTELLGVNSRAQLAELDAIAQQRLRNSAMDAGATLVAPETIFLSADTILETDVIIEPNVVIGPGVHIATGSHIKSFSHLERCYVGTCCVIGPYARLRPGTHLEDGVKIGNFVETKNARFEAGAKANHLSYIGDAEVGAAANIGAGTITCNYDGFGKHKTEIGDGAFIGSNSALVAPVRIGDGAIVGAGSTITKAVDDNAIATARGRQSQITDGAKQFRAKRKKPNG